MSEAVKVQRRLAIKEAAPLLIHPVRWARFVGSFIRNPKTSWRISRATRGRVRQGPFKGLRVSPFYHSAYSTLLGIYESPLIPVIEGAIARQPDVVVDVGAAYGYYAFGMAQRVPGAKHVAYEADVTRLNLLRRYRALNNLEGRVELRGMCMQDDLAAVLAQAKAPFVLVDIEGGEASLLDPKLVPALKRAELLVELHEMFVPGVTELLKSRFATTHRAEIISADGASSKNLDLGSLGLAGCSPDVVAAMIDEGREADMDWLHLIPNVAGAPKIGSNA